MAAVNRKKKTIFVTVGTTQFEPLIEAAVSKEALKCMEAHGFTHLVVQHGRGKRPLPHDGCPIDVQSYDFKASLLEDMGAADLILSHAGAGTIMEALALRTDRTGEPVRLAVVINSQLMDNHQTELAQAMGDRRHLFVVHEPDQLRRKETWTELMTDFVPVPKEPGDAQDFARIVDSFFGFNKTK